MTSAARIDTGVASASCRPLRISAWTSSARASAMIVASESSPSFRCASRIATASEAASQAASRSPSRRVRPRKLHQRLRGRPLRLRAFQVLGQAVEVIDLALGQARDNVEAAGVLELARKARREVAEEGLRLHAGLLREILGALRALRCSNRRRSPRRRRRRRARCRPRRPGARGPARGAWRRPARAARPASARWLRAPRARAARRGCALTTLHSTSCVSSTRRTSSRSSMRSRRRLTSVASASGAAPAAAKRLAQRLLRDVLAEARLGEQLVLDEPAHGRRLVGERALVEIAEDRVVRAGQQVERDLVAALRDARVVELAADRG